MGHVEAPERSFLELTRGAIEKLSILTLVHLNIRRARAIAYVVEIRAIFDGFHPLMVGIAAK
jgi:hypothetical protein